LNAIKEKIGRTSQKMFFKCNFVYIYNIHNNYNSQWYCFNFFPWNANKRNY